MPSQVGLYVSSWDADAGCDLIFGAPSDPECGPSVDGGAVCNATGQTLSTPPQPPSPYNYKISHGTYIRSGTPTYDTPWTDGNRWFATVHVPVAPACSGGTSPTCVVTTLSFTEWNTILAGAEADAIAAAYAGPWATQSLYIPAVGVATCQLIPFATQKHAPSPAPCD